MAKLDSALSVFQYCMFGVAIGIAYRGGDTIAAAPLCVSAMVSGYFSYKREVGRAGYTEG